MARGAKKTPSKARIELGRQAGFLVCMVLLVAAGIAALVVPGWGVPLGALLGGGNQITLTATTSDGSDASAEDTASAAANLQERANILWQHGITVAKTGDNTIAVNVPASYDASTISGALSPKGKMELVRLDSISDAEALAQINAGTSSVTLTEGTYTALATSDNVKHASVVSGKNAYTGSTVYAVGMTLDDEGAQALADATEELSSASGKIAVVVDGVVVTSPSVSSKIEGGELTVSGGFTRDQAYALASELIAGPVSLTLTAGETTQVNSAFGGTAFVGAIVACVIAAAVCALVCVFGFGKTGWISGAALVAAGVVSLGIMALLSRFELVILGTWELAGLAVAALACLVSCVLAQSRYAGERAQGSSVRKAQQEAVSGGYGLVAKVEGVVVVLCIAFSVWAKFAGVIQSDMATEFSCALAAGLGADLFVTLLLKAPLLLILTANDATKVDAEAAEQLEPAVEDADAEQPVAADDAEPAATDTTTDKQ